MAEPALVLRAIEDFRTCKEAAKAYLAARAEALSRPGNARAAGRH
jgi:hypothetical protein